MGRKGGKSGKSGSIGKGGFGKGGKGGFGGQSSEETGFGGLPSKGKGKGKGKGGKGGKGGYSSVEETGESTETTVPTSESCTCDGVAITADVLADVATTIADLTSQLLTATTQIRELEEPAVFSCKRMSGYSDESAPVSYTACDVEQPSGLVDLDSGKFTVQKDGVYRLTFTARMSAMNGQTIRTDMYVNDVLVGRSSANLDTSDTTTVLDLETTNTLDLNYELKAGDEVYVMVNYVGTTSLIQSSSNYQIFFTGECIRGL